MRPMLPPHHDTAAPCWMNWWMNCAQTAVSLRASTAVPLANSSPRNSGREAPPSPPTPDRAGTRLDLGKRALLGRSGPILEDCLCSTCRDWPVGVLAALFQAREPLVYRLASVHNLTLLNRILHDLRRSVLYTG